MFICVCVLLVGAASDGRQSPRSGYGQWGRSMDIRIGNEALDETLKQELLAKQTTQAYLNLRVRAMY